jgi:hypothetical protein
MQRIKSFQIFEALRNDKFFDSEIITPLVDEKETKVTYENGKYSVHGYVSIDKWKILSFYAKGILPTKTITKLPVQFDKIQGSFSLENLGLKTLEGCPEFVSGSFSITGNDLENLEGGPKFVGDTYSCFRNGLKSLKGSPQKVSSMYAESNNLENLEGAPKMVERNFYLNKNKLKNCEGIPGSIGNMLSIMEMSEGFSLKGLHNNIGKVMTDYFSIKWDPQSRIRYLKSDAEKEGKKLLLTFYEGCKVTQEEMEMLGEIADKIDIDLSDYNFPPDLASLIRVKQMFF